MKLLNIIIASVPLLISTNTFKVNKIIDEYDLTMTLKIPRVYNNTQSLGYRKDQTQTIKGILKIIYNDEFYRPTFEITDLINKTHKINGRNITYEVLVDNDGEYVFPRFNYIGDNRTEKFKKAKIILYFDANPNYNIGEDEPDNSLLVTLSGYGSSSKSSKYGDVYIVKRLSGFVTGTLGCGCTAYGHKSPTRVVGPNGPLYDYVDDVSPILGKWKAKFIRRSYK